MTSIELLNILTKRAEDYRLTANASLSRNGHMNELKENEEIDQKVIDAVLVDFINYVGINAGVDYALYTTDLK